MLTGQQERHLACKTFAQITCKGQPKQNLRVTEIANMIHTPDVLVVVQKKSTKNVDG